MTDSDRADVELLWQEFHEAVNMTSEELRTWLLTDASGEVALPADPGMKLPELGTKVVQLLRKRKVDLGPDDLAVMEQVADYVAERKANPPADGERDEDWRHSLMTVGHDPLKPS
ncbi:MAG TPA: DUF3140 domain-containing protein [Streptosporangiaceae bacterium]|nr:DUF3140 domain-containing protein [Streptosporangiaceae bacterium]